MSEERCIHDLLEGQCSSCKPAPFGINEIVYTTKGGQAFHNWEDCGFLRSGQDFAISKGQDNHPINPTKWSNVYYTIGPCEWCCALHQPCDKEHQTSFNPQSSPHQYRPQVKELRHRTDLTKQEFIEFCSARFEVIKHNLLSQLGY